MIAIAGLAAWYLLVAQVVLGVVYAAGLGRLMIAPRQKLRLHRWLTLWLLTAVGVHVSAIVMLHFRRWGPGQIFEIGPGSLARNCGAVTLWLLLVIALTRCRPFRALLTVGASRSLHRLSYLVLLLGTVHAVLAGPDADSLAVSGPGIACLSALAAAFAARQHKGLARRSRTAPARRRPLAISLRPGDPGPQLRPAVPHGRHRRVTATPGPPALRSARTAGGAASREDSIGAAAGTVLPRSPQAGLFIALRAFSDLAGRSADALWVTYREAADLAGGEIG